MNKETYEALKKVIGDLKERKKEYITRLKIEIETINGLIEYRKKIKKDYIDLLAKKEAFKYSIQLFKKLIK